MGDLTDYRLKLLRAGFKPICLNGKRPPMDKWDAKIETNPDEIALWEKVFSGAKNTGCFTRWMPTIDIDITDPFAADSIDHLARDQFGERGVYLTRFGLKPKRAIPLRTSQPFKK